MLDIQVTPGFSARGSRLLSIPHGSCEDSVELAEVAVGRSGSEGFWSLWIVLCYRKV